MPLRVKVDPLKCVGCGLCATIAPKVFELSPAGHSTIREPFRSSDAEGLVPDELAELVLQAARSCPSSAIQVRRE